jgi:hypothetical protein
MRVSFCGVTLGGNKNTTGGNSSQKNLNRGKRLQAPLVPLSFAFYIAIIKQFLQVVDF